MIELGFFFIDIDLTMHLNIIVPLINLCLLRVFKFILFITTKHVSEMIDVSHNLINGFKFEPENAVVYVVYFIALVVPPDSYRD